MTEKKLTDDFAELNPTVDEAAYTIYKRWKRYAEFNDIRQHIWLWLADGWQDKQTWELSKLSRGMRNAAERYCRKEKASKAGYETVDEQYYSLNKLEKLIYEAFDSEAVPSAETYRDDELYSEWATEVADVRKALNSKRFPIKHYWVLKDYVGSAEATRTGPVDDALRALQRLLGGSRPYV